MQYTGPLKKMLTELKFPIQYYLSLKDDFLHINQLIGQEMEICYIANECKSCRLDKPIFRMGFCKNCFFTAPEANPNIIKPELSQAHLGIETRDLVWEKEFELQPHIVYLAESGSIKVGVTREKQIPFRWIDQGADQAIVLAKTENRYEAGMIEVALKEYYADKTNWRQMLTAKADQFDLIEEKIKAKNFIPTDFQKFYVEEGEVYDFEFPVKTYLPKVKSVKLSLNKPFCGKLMGIKGQYLIFENQEVINVRGNEGKVVTIKI